MPQLSRNRLDRSSPWCIKPLATIKEVDVPTCREGWVTIKPIYGTLPGVDSLLASSNLSRIEYNVGWRGSKSQHIDTIKKMRNVNWEMTGVVEDVGVGVSHFAKGQTVVLLPSHESSDYEHGELQYFEEDRHMNSYILCSAPSSCFYPLPASISLQSATHLTALATAYYALLRASPFRSLDNVLIVSSNCISLFLIRLLSLQKALTIIAVECDPTLKRLAIQFGATHVLDPGDIDVSESVRLLTDDRGVDIVFQISDQGDYEPAPHIFSHGDDLLKRIEAWDAANSAISACRARGTIVNIAPRGMYENRKSKFRNELMMHEVQYVGSVGYDFASLKAAVGLMERGDVTIEGISLA